ncbi:hypothetical protein HYR99_28860 [Candidatus Poribacteria bacterium]|nr:hypothetical protein [Candidatus Poribacteria bacterium]
MKKVLIYAMCLIGLSFIGQLANAQEKITGPWLWMIAPTEANRGGAASTDIDSLDKASGGKVTEEMVAKNGAKEGDAVGNLKWTKGELSAAGGDNVNEAVTKIKLGVGDINDHSAYALITIESAKEQNAVTMRVGSDDSIKVWLNGEVVWKTPWIGGHQDFRIHSKWI